MQNKIEKKIAINHDHPSLDGHFPGYPILPGVVILDYVRQLIEEWKRTTTRALKLESVKFISPLLMNGQGSSVFNIVLEEKQVSTASVRLKLDFSCLQDGHVFVQGVWQLQVDGI